ncbi:MAG: hypothetical protein E7316_03880 [Clostridiales bacterium]|nr:hypothetical protein [Clostridiales bacterium]
MPKKLILCLLVLLLPITALADVIINEVCGLNGTYKNEHAYDWIELYNNGTKTVNLSGWYLSDSKKDLQKWAFPKGTKLKKGAYLTVYCTGEEDIAPGREATFYSTFKISSGGEKLYLSDSEGNLLQTLEVPQQYGCVTYGLPAGGTEYGFFENDTRGKKNDKTAYTFRVDEPVITTPGGFYDEAVTITATAPEGATLRYTTNGTTPTAKSKEFPAKGLEIKKTTVLRVKAFREDAVSSQAVSASYFIGDTLKTPVVSLITDEKYLFNSKTGALVKGSGETPNYAKELEYPVNIEYYTLEGQCQINQMGTFTCSGHSARVNAQKSIALYARNEYGDDTFTFNPFPTRDYSDYKSLLLRAANSDTYATRIRDIVASSLAEGQGLLYQDHVVIQVYINGEYWGHYNLREKINKHFIAQYEGVTDEKDIDNIDILARNGTDRFTQNGDNADWEALADFCKTNDLNDPENLQYVLDRLDVDNMFTHAAFEIILGNVDYTNVRVYRVPGGKWKYLLFDVEACWRNLDATPTEYYIKKVSAKVQGFRHEPLNALLAVPEYKAKFLTRVAEILEECFQWPHVEARFDDVIAQLDPILDRHIRRWDNMKRSNWNKNIGAIKYYARVRPRKIAEMLQKAMKLTDEEVELYFGEVQALLEVTNARPE